MELDAVREVAAGAAHGLHARGVDVAGHHARGALLAEELDERAAHVAAALHRDGLALQRPEPERVKGALHAADHAHGRGHGRVARAAELGADAGEVARGLEDHIHVLHAHARVLGGHVRAAQAGHKMPVGAQQIAAPHGVAHQREVLAVRDDALAAAPPQAGQRILAAHARGQAQAVAHECLGVRVGPQPDAARALAALRAPQEGAHEAVAVRLHEDGLVPVVVHAVALQQRAQRL
mmetsp:Transcript_23779/g.67493  ORF Transcript_23779/g.67493 Transcript_23779/m.67493 type:complete len:236 (+) Transcript_23779:1350-2057(+)